MTIDFDNGISLAEVEEQTTLGSDKSTWVKTLTELHDACAEGRAEFGKFYLVGTFKNSSGAQTAVRNIGKNYADRLPGNGFDLRPITKPPTEDSNGNRTSVLYAAAVAPEDDETEDEDNEPVEEQPTPAARKRQRG